MMKSVAVIAVPTLSLFEFGVVGEVFGIDRSALNVGLPAFEFTTCTAVPGLMATNAGVSVSIEHDLSAVQDADLVVMAPYSRGTPLPSSVADALQAANDRGARILSVCSGAFALAEAGLLDGRKATTHWKYSQQLAAEYPNIDVDEDVLYVEDGNIITSAGTAAGIDACLYLVRKEFGAKAATAIARGMVVPPHRDGGQAQYIDRPVPIRTGDPMEELLVWLSENVDKQFSIKELAQRMHMSDRTFARRFRAATGTTPASWITSQRILRAQTLLEDSQLSIDEIAREAGFGHAVLLRHHFQRTLGTSPASYRQAFRGRVLSP